MGRRMVAPILFGVALCLATEPARAQILVGSVQSVDAVLDTVKYVATLAGREDVARQLEPLIKDLAGGKGLISLDRKAVLGFYVQALSSKPKELPNPSLVVFLPITDEDAFVELLKGLNCQVDRPDPNGVRAVMLPTGQTVYLRFAHGHAFVSQEHTALTRQLPNPRQLISPKHASHLIYVSLRLREIPPAVRKKLLSQLEKAISQPIPRKPEETEESYQVRRQLGEAARSLVVQLLADLDELVLWADLDKANHQLNVTVDVVARPGSPSASAFHRWGQTPSRLRALPGQAGSSVILAYPVEGPLRVVLDQVASVLEKSIAQKPQEQQVLLRKLYEGILPTLKAERLELAFLIHGPAADGKLTPLVALGLREGTKLEAALRELVKVLPEDAKANIRLDAAQLAGRNCHELRISPEDPNFRRLFGEEKLSVLLTRDYLLLSGGTHALMVLKQALGQLERDQIGPAGSLEISLRQLAVFASDKPEGQRFYQAVQRTFQGKDETRDRLRIVQEGQEDRLRIRLELPTLLIRAAVLANQ